MRYFCSTFPLQVPAAHPDHRHRKRPIAAGSAPVVRVWPTRVPKPPPKSGHPNFPYLVSSPNKVFDDIGNYGVKSVL
jgi:hypothetical protein